MKKNKERVIWSSKEVAARYKSDPEFRDQFSATFKRDTAILLLVTFTQEGELRWVQELLARNAPVNGKLDDVSALLFASDRGQMEFVRLLLEHGASTDLRCINGQTALIRAAIKDNIEVMRLLIQHGANVNLQDDFGSTALHYACENPTSEAATILLDSRANPNIYDKSGLSPIMIASREGKAGLVRALLNRGSRLTDKNRQGVGALVFAIKEQHGQVASLLLDQDINVNDQWNGNSPLAVTIMGSIRQPTPESIEQGEDMNMEPEPESRAFTARILDLLIGLNADPFAPSGQNGFSALNLSAILGHTDVMERLLSTGIDANEVTAPDATPLEMACKAGRLDMATLLLERGADIELKNQEGQTCLLHAVWSGNTDLVKFLVNHGADVNTEDKRAATSLELAVRRDHREMVELLVGAGADVNARVEENSNIMELAAKVSSANVKSILVSHGARYPEQPEKKDDTDLDAREEISRAVHAGDLAQALELARGLNDPEAEASIAATILKAATDINDLALIDRIFTRYPDVNVQDALAVAASSGDLRLLAHFVERSSSKDPRQANVNYRPAFRAAVRSGHFKAFEILSTVSADIQTDSNLRDSLVVIAASETNVVLTRKLLQLGCGIESGRLNSGGMRALRIAVLESNDKLINCLVDAGTLSQEDLEKQSDPIMVICTRRNHLRLAKRLLDRGAAINAAGRNGATPLMVASNRGYTEIAKLLLIRGADINLVDDRGRTALEHAIGRNRIDIIKLLKASGAKSAQEMK